MNKEKIIDYVNEVHKGQKRKAGDPYINHIVEVADFTANITKTYINRYDFLENELEDLYCAALLHDTIEDTNTDFEDIVNLTNNRVAEWVSTLSNDKRLPQDSRNSLYYSRILASCIEVKIIKLADIYSNVSGVKGTEGDHWIKSYMKKAKKTLNALSPEMKENELFIETEQLISKWEK